MKKLFLLFLVSQLVIGTAVAARLKTSQSFLFTRPAYDNVEAMQFLWRHALGDERSVFQITPIYQKSTDGSDLGRYFLLNCQKDILVAGDASPLATERDVRAEWLGLPSTFSGNYSLNPQQTQYAVTLAGYYHLKSAWTYLENSWLGLVAPVVGVKNQARPRQFNSTNSEGPVTGTEIIEALARPEMRYGKISPCALTKHTIPELRFIFGTTWTTKNDFLLLYYTGVAAPTIKRQHPNYLFGPVIGHNRHYEIIAGFSAELPLHPECSDLHSKLFFLAENNFLIRNHQLRSFDLYKKPWTRYMQLRKAVTQPDGTIIGSTETTPAVNVLTFPVRVHPNSYFNMSAGLSTDYHGFNLEVGWQMWAHTRERLQMMKSCCEGRPLAFQEFGIAGTGTSSASHSLINTQAHNDLFFTPIKLGDIDLHSGANRGAFSQSINAALGYRAHYGFIGVGGFWEKANCDTAFEQWGIWGTAALNF